MFDALEVLGDPVDERTAIASELVGAHVAERRREPVRTRPAWGSQGRRARHHVQRLVLTVVLGHRRASIMAARQVAPDGGQAEERPQDSRKRRGGQKRWLVVAVPSGRCSGPGCRLRAVRGRRHALILRAALPYLMPTLFADDRESCRDAGSTEMTP